MPRLNGNNLVAAPLYLCGLDCYAIVEAYVGTYNAKNPTKDTSKCLWR
jgi:hypothetical protein